MYETNGEAGPFEIGFEQINGLIPVRTSGSAPLFAGYEYVDLKVTNP